MGVRAQRKDDTRARILAGAARVLRERGLEGAGVATIMREAGLTHGAFYAHFESRRDLVTSALREASEGTRTWYFKGLTGRSGLDWLRAAVGRYLTPRHRDTPGAGCFLAGLAGDVARGDEDLRRTFESELASVSDAFSERLDEAGHDDAEDRALAILSLCAGGVAMSRAVADRALSNRILRACQALAERDLGGRTAEGAG